jgi:mannose-1-phosphate guanylyltransferase
MDTRGGEIDSRSVETPALQAAFGAVRREALRPPDSTHVLILAGGDGVRLRNVTRAFAGDDRPKQFCALAGRETLVVQAQLRAALVAPAGQVLTVLTRRHEAWYRELIAGLPESRFVIQPENRGTATGVLYGLMRIAARAPDAPVVILPSDHWVSDDSAFMLHAQAAVGFVQAHPASVVLLGVEPTRPETEYGWIEAGEPAAGGWRGLSRVARFLEKPSAEVADALSRDGRTLWNTSVVVGRVKQLLLLFALAQPALVDAFLEIWNALGSPDEESAVDRVYAALPTWDFSRHVLAVQPEALAVLAVRGPAWEDLGHLRGLIEARRLSVFATAEPPRRRIRRETPSAARRRGPRQATSGVA